MSRPFLLAIALAVLAGCGRGGSSGLDIANENRVIDTALRQQRCQDFRGLTICPADAAGSAGAPRIDTDLADATSIDCFQATPAGACTFTLVFTPQAFASGTTFDVLGRSSVAGSPWILGTDPVPAGGASMTATVALGGSGGVPSQVQLAVLAFDAASSSASEVDELHDTAASFAFVTAVLNVNVITPTATPTPTGRPTNTATATRTPGAGDCCQCEASCAEPVGGSCGSCAVVFEAACFGETLCTARTPTPTASPTPTAVGCLSDNGDGTIADHCTGLTWEKKEAADGLHDYADTYPWAGVCNHALHTLCQPDAAAASTCAAATGGAVGCAECPEGMLCIDFDSSDIEHATSTVWSWLAQLNQAPGFAGHTDWRLPSVGRDGGVGELETIVAPTCGTGGGCVDHAFDLNCEVGEICGPNHACSDGSTCLQRPDLAERVCEGSCTVATCSCTWPQYYWSVVDAASDGDNGWHLDFSNGSVGEDGKTSNGAVRAVRGVMTPGPSRTPTPTAGATATPCFVDNGDGTVSDPCRGLRWEKKDRAGGLHDVDALYTWAGTCTGASGLCQPSAGAAATCTQQTGGDEGCQVCASGTCVVDPDHNGATTTIWEWLNQLNASTFAGFNDWRIPTVGFQGDTAELETLCTGSGSVPSAFSASCSGGCTVETCSCTQTTLQDYWSATSIGFDPGLADGVSFVFCGSVGAGPKSNANSIRAVRRER